MIAVVDYRKGNLQSVARGIAAAGGDVCVTDDAAVIARADGIVLPGVGAFADAAATMEETGQMDAVRDAIGRGVPFLGICLGEHLLFEHGVEGAPDGEPACGLGVLPGTVGKLPRENAAGEPFKIPHVGWNTVEPVGDCPLFAGIPPRTYFYFTHSYVAPDGPATRAFTEHSVRFPSAVQVGTVAFGVQFHPEKSSDAGAAVLRNFVNLVKGA